MTKYFRPSALGAARVSPVPSRPPFLPSLHSTMIDDPLAPETTIYWDQSTGAQQPGAGGPMVASRIWYDGSLSMMSTDNVQDAIDILDNRVDSMSGTGGLEARVGVLEVEMDAAQADIIALQGNIVTLQAADTNLQSQINALDVRLDTLEPIVNVHTTDIAALDTRVDAIEAKNVEQDGRLDAVEAADVVMDGRMDAAEADITALEGKTNQATETTAGIAEIATQAETNAGADDARIVTPLKLRNLNGWHVGPLGIGRAPTSLMDIFSTTTAIYTAEAPSAGLYLKNSTLTWQVMGGPAKLLMGHKDFPTTRVIAMNVAGEVAIGSDAQDAGVALKVNGQLRVYGPVLAEAQALGDTFGIYRAGDVRHFQAYTNNSLTWNGLDSTWRFINGGVERMTITGGNGVYFNGIAPAVIDNQSRLCLRTYTNVMRPPPAGVPDGTMMYVPDSSVGFLQVKHGGTYYTFSPVMSP